VEDFARHPRRAVAEPIATSYRGLDLVELPPNGQGLTALVLLNILERFDLTKFEPKQRGPAASDARGVAHRFRRARHATSPIQPTMRASVPAFIDKTFAARLADRIDLSRRSELPTAPTAGSDRPSHRGRTGIGTAVSLNSTRWLPHSAWHLHRQDRHHAAQFAAPASGSIPHTPLHRPGKRPMHHDHSGPRAPRRPLRGDYRRHGRRLFSRWDTSTS